MKKVKKNYWTKIRIERLAKGLAKQEKKFFGKYDKAVARVSVQPNNLHKLLLAERKKQKIEKKYNRINKSDRLREYHKRGGNIQI